MPDAGRFNELIAAFSQANGQASLPVDEQGVCSFVVDQTLPVNLAAAGDGEELGVFAPLGRVPEMHRTQWLTRMLEANGAGAGMYRLGLAPGSSSAVLSARRPMAGLDSAELTRWLGEFVSVGRAWMSALAAGTPPAAPAAPGESWLQV